MVTARVRLIVLYGGQSAEHEVSCISAANVWRAADPERYDLRLIGVTTTGEWVDATAAAASTATAPALASPDGLAWHTAATTVPMALDQLRDLADDAAGTVVVLPLLHGPMGEDGTVQGLLDLAGLAYVGAGVSGSAAAMDKGMAKALLASAGLPQVRHLSARDTEIDDLWRKRAAVELGWPMFVKPANMGSSIGVSKAAGPAELVAALSLAARYDEYLIVEEAVRGREIEVGVLGWPDLKASVPGEIRPSREFYDFDDKYLTRASQLVVPADLAADVTTRLRELAVDACRALRVDGMARVDFFVEEGGRGPLVNEVNTIPGFTPTSMYPMLWAASGVPYPTLIDRLVELARRRHDRRSRFETQRN